MELKRLLAGAKDKKILLLVGVLGLVLLLVGRWGGETKTPESGLPTSEEYKAGLESSLRALCEEVRGVGEARVLVTVDGTETAVYEKNVTATGETLATAGGSAVLSYYVAPKVMGVAVVCDGGDDPTVKRELTSLLCAALSLGSNQVYVGKR